MEVVLVNTVVKYPAFNFAPSYPTCQFYPSAELSSEIRYTDQK